MSTAQSYNCLLYIVSLSSRGTKAVHAGGGVYEAQLNSLSVSTGLRWRVVVDTFAHIKQTNDGVILMSVSQQEWVRTQRERCLEIEWRLRARGGDLLLALGNLRLKLSGVGVRVTCSNSGPSCA